MSWTFLCRLMFQWWYFGEIWTLLLYACLLVTLVHAKLTFTCQNKFIFSNVLICNICHHFNQLSRYDWLDYNLTIIFMVRLCTGHRILLIYTLCITITSTWYYEQFWFNYLAAKFFCVPSAKLFQRCLKSVNFVMLHIPPEIPDFKNCWNQKLQKRNLIFKLL